MSNSRQLPSQVRGNATTHPPGLVSLPTQPGWDYLVFAKTGLITAFGESQVWTVPAHRALCVPDGTEIRVETTRRTAVRCLYFATDLKALGREMRVVTLTPLSRELVTHAVAAAPMRLDAAANTALITLIADRLAAEPDVDLHLPLPVDGEANRVALSMMADPTLGLDDYLVDANTSRRTLERRFKLETGMSLGQWRRRARILAAVATLAEGQSVTQTAMAVGYATPSSFVAAFRSELGAPPREFIRRS